MSIPSHKRAASSKSNGGEGNDKCSVMPQWTREDHIFLPQICLWSTSIEKISRILQQGTQTRTSSRISALTSWCRGSNRHLSRDKLQRALLTSRTRTAGSLMIPPDHWGVLTRPFVATQSTSQLYRSSPSRGNMN